MTESQEGFLLSDFLGSALFLLVSVKAAFWSAFSVLFYVFVYSIWLKRRTPQNIVIGGIAGSTPPLIGWAAAAGSSIANANMLDLGSPVPWMLFFLIFLWTPPHFWALALVKNEDYKQAGVPMLPVVAGKPETLRQIVIYSALLAPLGVAPYLLGMTSPFYGLLAAGMGAVFMVLALRLYKTPDDRQAWALFKFSVFFLTVLFASLILDKLLVQHLGVLAILGLQ